MFKRAQVFTFIFTNIAQCSEVINNIHLNTIEYCEFGISRNGWRKMVIGTSFSKSITTSEFRILWRLEYSRIGIGLGRMRITHVCGTNHKTKDLSTGSRRFVKTFYDDLRYILLRKFFEMERKYLSKYYFVSYV